MQSTYFLRLSASPLMLPLFLLLSPPLAHSHADAVAEFRSLTISKQRAYTVEKDDVRLGLWQSYYELSRKCSDVLKCCFLSVIRSYIKKFLLSIPVSIVTSHQRQLFAKFIIWSNKKTPTSTWTCMRPKESSYFSTVYALSLFCLESGQRVWVRWCSSVWVCGGRLTHFGVERPSAV